MIANLDAALSGCSSPEEGIKRAVELIHKSNPLYHWTGVYLMSGKELALSHQIGLPTPHERISIDEGICGAAAREKKTVIVEDVNADPRYIACSLKTRSEIVVPLMGSTGAVLGEIDIDSDESGAFTGSDRIILEEAAIKIAAFLESSVAPHPAKPALDGIDGDAGRQGDAQ
jgi:L-methionine (R)-S-oxide reductase